MSDADVVHRLTKLQELTSLLSRVHTEGEVAQAIAMLGRSAVGSLAALVWVASRDTLVLAGNDGVPESYASQWARIPLAAPNPPPVVGVFRRQQTLWVETESDYEAASADVAAKARAAGRMLAYATLPLVQTTKRSAS